jgi:hypothetical protein
MKQTLLALEASVRRCIALWGAIVATFVMSACAPERTIGDDSSALGKNSAAALSARSNAAPVDPEPPPHTEVKLNWRGVQKLSGTILDRSQVLYADMENATNRALTGRLVLLAAGLDGRTVEQPIETFSLPGGSSREIAVQVDTLPIQSEVSMSFAAVRAEVDRPKGFARASTAPLYYRFQNGYREALFLHVTDAGKQPNGGLLPGDLMNVQGRIREANGTWTDAAVASAKARADAKALGGGYQGLTGFGRLAVDPAREKGNRGPGSGAQVQPVRPDDSASAAPEATLMVCTTWWAWYTDAGFGEDYLDTSNSFHVRSSFAYAYITDAGSTTTFWQGNLDSAGCAFVTLPPGNYLLSQFTDWTMSSYTGSGFEVYFMDNGSAEASYAYAAFTVYSGTSWVNLNPSASDDAIQAAAVAGQIVLQNEVAPGGLGMTPGSYVIHTNEGCGPPIEPPTDSCYDPSPPGGVVHLGTTSIDGTAEANWKYIIAHEIGHYVQDRAMGWHSYGYDDSATEASCKCDHYDTSWGNQLHCIQSREIIGGAQLEGFAHAFASRVFNWTSDSNATFVYYKPFLYDSSFVGYPPLGFDAYNPYLWMEDHCTSSGRGVELDWLNFYYGVSSEDTANQTIFSNLFEIYMQTCTGNAGIACSGQDVQWSALLTNAQAYYGGSAANSYYLRFRDRGIDSGIDH